MKEESLQNPTKQPACTEREEGPRKEHGSSESSPATKCLETRLTQSTREHVLLQHILFIQINS